ncbi:hypothetical protein FLP30_13320 (plasmid) [Acetobacter vaccinii]|uniref:Uncharacterized protein n=1 Tax=Acetobacter vaccinii TaxID=2592655 RepID=A0A5C1YR65_9PROT|nr:hypothetical protein FLP30_13320 [Acetobacter vaccinii]
MIHTPINARKMESQSRPQYQRVFRTLHLRKVCWAVCALVTTTSKQRLTPTESFMRPDQLEKL